jgi:dipeptidyl aminopeptidase/acylaminoacyl peptidase
MKNCLLIIFAFCLTVITIQAQTNEELLKEISSLKSQLGNLQNNFDALEKSIDDIAMTHRLGDISFVDKVELTGPPPAKKRSGGSLNPPYTNENPLRFKTYVFIPKNVESNKKYPLLVLVHGGVHGNFNSYYYHIIRELIAQGYVVTAPEYRGSNAYGRGFMETIDYGGLENADVKASRDYMIEHYSFVDAERVGILGWSHGGMITLMNLFDYPGAYKAGYAGVPVSDLIARMGYKTESYRGLFSAPYHLGKTAYEDVEEYKKRSPAWNAFKLKTPLLIHTNTNDEDVNVLEVEHLIKALKAEGKKFEYEIFQNKPGGHGFDRIDTMIAKEIRLKVYRFLNGYLKPANPFNNLKELHKAGYVY